MVEKVIVDTTMWSMAHRRKKHTERELDTVRSLNKMIVSGRAVMLGAVRQEVLSGISDTNIFNKLKEKLSRFTDYVPDTSDYELAAELSNVCRRNGIQGSTTDFLICAVAVKNNWRIFSDDTDFVTYRQYIPIRMYKARPEMPPRI